MSLPSPTPFPWSTLARVTQRDVDAARQARAFIEPHTNFGVIMHAASELLHCPVEVQLRGISTSATKPAVDGIRFAMTHDQEAPPLEIEFEPTFAATLVAHALHREVPVFDADKQPSAFLVGATGAFLSLAARRSGQPWRLARRPPVATGTTAIAHLNVRLGVETFLTRVLVPLPDIAVPPPVFDGHALASLGEVPLTLPLVISAAEAGREDLAVFDPGSAWCLSDSCQMREQSNGWQGHGMLLGPGSERGLRVAVQPPERGKPPVLVLEAGSVSSPWDPRATDTLEHPRWIVRCEVGSVTLPAHVWAAQKPGDRIAMTRWTPHNVTLRVSSAPFARGQLMWLSTEAAVRIITRLPFDLPPPASERPSPDAGQAP